MAHCEVKEKPGAKALGFLVRASTCGRGKGRHQGTPLFLGWPGYNGGMNQISRENFHVLLEAFVKKNQLPLRRVAAAVPCSDATLTRLLMGATLPADEMLREGAFLIELGFERYSKLSRAEREKLSDALGAVGGGTIGFASVSGAVSVLGLAGLSAAGISSGLAALGSVIGGGMAAGVPVAAALPVAAAGIGYGAVRAVKHAASVRQLNQKDIDPRWEISAEPSSNAISLSPSP